jgi:3-deoxy-7-phosphoheptulonate synthase
MNQFIETHNHPEKALSDGAQSLDLKQFASLMKEINRSTAFENKTMTAC